VPVAGVMDEENAFHVAGTNVVHERGWTVYLRSKVIEGLNVFRMLLKVDRKF